MKVYVCKSCLGSFVIDFGRSREMTLKEIK